MTRGRIAFSSNMAHRGRVCHIRAAVCVMQHCLCRIIIYKRNAKKKRNDCTWHGKAERITTRCCWRIVFRIRKHEKYFRRALRSGLMTKGYEKSPERRHACKCGHQNHLSAPESDMQASDLKQACRYMTREMKKQVLE